MNRLVLILTVLLVMLSGCDNPYYRADSGLAHAGNASYSGDGFRMTGHLTVGGVSSNETIENVSVRFYHQNGSLIESRRLGDLNASNREPGLNTSVTFTKRPFYVVFTSPDVWERGLSTTYYEFNPASGEYLYVSTDNRSALPVALNISQRDGNLTSS